MSIRFHSPVLLVENIDTMRKFYEDVLDQEVESDFGACIVFKCGLSLWKPSENHAINQHFNKLGTVGVKSQMELCFESDNFETTFSKLKNNHLNLLHDLVEEPWGQQTIRFFDPENNLVEFGESIPCFVRRMHHEGLRNDEISTKTSIAIPKIKEYLLK